MVSASPPGLIVAIQDSDPHRPPRKVLRIVAGKDGSYSVSVPYHPATTGMLYKVTVFDGWEGYPTEFHSRYRVNSKVKLSLHSSGFVSFSGGSPVIRSGEAGLHVVKGIGVHSHPFTDPIDTGPTWMASVFDLGEFDLLEEEESAPVLLFNHFDFFHRDEHDLVGRHQYTIEGWMFPAAARRTAVLGPRGWYFEAPYGTIRTNWTVAYRVIDLPTAFSFLGLVVSLQHLPPDIGGGYGLAGPKDITTGAMVQGKFPAPDDERDLPDLTYDRSDPLPRDPIDAAIKAVALQAREGRIDTGRRFVLGQPMHPWPKRRYTDDLVEDE